MRESSLKQETDRETFLCFMTECWSTVKYMEISVFVGEDEIYMLLDPTGELPDNSKVHLFCFFLSFLFILSLIPLNSYISLIHLNWFYSAAFLNNGNRFLNHVHFSGSFFLRSLRFSQYIEGALYFSMHNILLRELSSMHISLLLYLYFIYRSLVTMQISCRPILDFLPRQGISFLLVQR